MEGWTPVGPSLLPAQPNPQRNDEEGRREEETEWQRDDCPQSSPGGFSRHNTSKGNIWQRRKQTNTTILRHTQTCLSFKMLFFSRWAAVTLFFFLNALSSLHLCNIFKKCSKENEKMIWECHYVAYRSVFFFFVYLSFVFYVLDSLTASLFYHISLLSCLYRQNRY